MRHPFHDRIRILTVLRSFCALFEHFSIHIMNLSVCLEGSQENSKTPPVNDTRPLDTPFDTFHEPAVAVSIEV